LTAKQNKNKSSVFLRLKTCKSRQKDDRTQIEKANFFNFWIQFYIFITKNGLHQEMENNLSEETLEVQDQKEEGKPHSPGNESRPSYQHSRNLREREDGLEESFG
jgi:hypothetical protein